jgi:hypothetical protein
MMRKKIKSEGDGTGLYAIKDKIQIHSNAARILYFKNSEAKIIMTQ